MSIAILIPAIHRPHRVAPLVENIRATTPADHRVLFVCDPHDRKTQDQVALAGVSMISPGGTYAQKINAGIRHTDEPYVFLGADDLRFHQGWLEAAVALMSDRVGVVGTNDLGNQRVMRGDHATHSLVARWYADIGTIDSPAGLLHEGYAHQFVDDELVATAKRRGAWAFAHDSHVEHLHPDWGKGNPDAVYDKGRSSWARDRRLFRTRSRLWA